MKNRHDELNNRNKKVVRLQLDADFFFERAMRYLDRYQHDKAIKYFKLAIEKEPDNPVFLCHLAGALCDVGRYEESNELLEMVLRDLDPHLHECLFYIANNLAYLGEFESAEDYLLEYLSRDPEGEYAEEAEEMLQMVSYELGRPVKDVSFINLQPHEQKHEEARIHLEEGRFLQAAEILEELVQQEEETLVAYNNLALTYFYMGRMAEALQATEKVLELDPTNLHALCNLAVFSYHIGEEKKGKQIIHALKKLIPFHPDHAYKLATTMGVLGEHEVAFELFNRLLKLEMEPEGNLFHYAASAACNTGRLRLAERYWREASWVDPDSDVPRFYLEQVRTWLTQPESSIPKVSYQYQLPFEEQILRMDEETSLLQLKSHPLFRSSFFWAINHGDHHTKLQVLHILGTLGDQESEELLRQFLLRPEEEEELKKVALLILRHLKAEPPFMMWREGAIVKVDGVKSSHLAPSEHRMEQEEGPIIWQKVLEGCLIHITSPTLQEDVRTLWHHFTTDEEPPTIRKAEAWSAALEYVILKHRGMAVIQQELADKYHVSATTISKNAKQLMPWAEKYLI